MSGLALITGHAAFARVERLAPPGAHVIDINVKVAALMTTEILMRRLKLPEGVSRVILPGRARVDLEALSAKFAAAFEYGPEEINDLPRHLGRKGPPPDLSRHDMRLFAEIIDAPAMSIAELITAAERLKAAGADVIDLGCRPGTPFPHLPEAVRALKAAGFAVSVDSGDPAELLAGARAGADHLLSLTRETLWIAEETEAVPVLIPSAPGDMESLLKAMDILAAKGRPFIADSVLDPIHAGFMASLERYALLRRLRPEAEILMGTGNLTELTEADSGGVTAVLLGLCSELNIRNILTVQVSPHTRRTLQEHDAARRMLFAARADGSPLKGYGEELLGLHERRPFPNTPAEIRDTAAQIGDKNWRIETAADGVHLYNATGHWVGSDAYALWPHLKGVDPSHAFYLGAELMKAETAFRLGKRYAQDRPLNWGVAAEAPPERPHREREASND